MQTEDMRFCFVFFFLTIRSYTSLLRAVNKLISTVEKYLGDLNLYRIHSNISINFHHPRTELADVNFNLMHLGTRPTWHRDLPQSWCRDKLSKQTHTYKSLFGNVLSHTRLSVTLKRCFCTMILCASSPGLGEWVVQIWFLACWHEFN